VRHPEKARRGIEVDTKKQLIDVVITAGKGAETSLVNKLVDLMPERLEERMKNEGGHILY
jgi:hypothetical protein